MLFDKLMKYWVVRNPVKLEHQDNWDGEVITPFHLNENFTPVKYKKIVRIKRKKKQNVTRAFGDYLKEEKKGE